VINHKPEIEELKKAIEYHKNAAKEAEEKIDALEGDFISTLNTGDKIKVSRKDDNGKEVIHRGIFVRVRLMYKNNFEWLDVDQDAYLDKVRYNAHADSLVQVGWDEVPVEPVPPAEEKSFFDKYLTEERCRNCANFEVVKTYQGMVHETMNYYCKKHNSKVDSDYKCDDFGFKPIEPPEPELPKVERTCGNCKYFRVWGASWGCDKTAHSTKPDSCCGKWREFKEEA